MTVSRFWARMRTLLLRPLPRQKLSLYFGLGSCMFALFALFYAGRIFELQRRDALLFELEQRHQDYERLLLSAECLHQNASGIALKIEDMNTLRRVSAQLRAALLLKREATLGELLEARDEVLTVGSGAAVGLMRYSMTVRQRLEGDAFSRVASCMW